MSLQTFRSRVPIVARMVDRAFNGDNADKDTQVEFIMVSAHPDESEPSATIVSVVTNCRSKHDVVRLLLMAIDSSSDEHATPFAEPAAGHA